MDPEVAAEEPCKSPSLLSSLRQFRYTGQQPHTVHGTSEAPDRPLKLNMDIFKRLHDDSGSDTMPPVKKEKIINGEASESKTNKVEEALKYLKKIFPLMDPLDIQDAFLQSDQNVDLAVKKLNLVIISKIDIKPAPRPVATASTMTSKGVATDRMWKRIRNGPPQFKFAKANGTAPAVTAPALTMPAVQHKPTVLAKPVSLLIKKERDNGLGYYNPRAKKQSVLDFLSSASLAELVTVPSVTKKKAEIIIKARPFSEWHSFCKKIEHSGIAAVDSLYDNVAELLRVRSEVTGLMRTCSELAQQLDYKVRQMSDNPDTLVEQPSSLTPELKLAGYQMVGLNWLKLLHNQKVNGILADEMGLGKTIQVIAFLAYLKERKLNEAVHLIVVPSSTLENWMLEFARWCPALKVESYYGSQEERRELRFWWRDEKSKEDVAKVDILLTTYNLVNSTNEDKGFFQKLNIHYIIYDEAHMLKNMATQRYASLMRVRGKRRILLTGTPLQNNIIELMSLLIFVMPDIFAEKQNDLKVLFKTTKAVCDEHCSFEKEKIQQAKKIMEPFVLRRLKKDVLGDLPSKTELLEYCELTTAQAECYNALLREFQNAGDTDDLSEDTPEPDEDEETGKDASTAKDDSDEHLPGGMAMMMLLRRAANHTALLRRHFTDTIIKAMATKLKRDRSYREENLENIEITLFNMSDHQLNKLCSTYSCISRYRITNDFILESGKINKLDELLPTLKEEKHRVLLFSQFRQAIDVLEDYMVVRQHKYCRLDGTTPVAERQTMIDEFNADDSIFVFLLTTKAGGCGINLASADTVIIHDIDLNPYNDKQAEDRCHRVGQQRPVTIIRLVSKDTIEEAMLKIATNKLTLERQITHGVNSKESDRKMLGLLKEALKAQ